MLRALLTQTVNTPTVLLPYTPPAPAPAPGPEQTDPDTLTTLKAVTTGGLTWRQAQPKPATDQGTYVSGEYRVMRPARALRIAYGGGNGMQTATYPTLRASIEHRGTIYPFTWGGAETLSTLSSASRHAYSDPVDLQVEAGETLRIRTWFPAGGTAPLCMRGPITGGTIYADRVYGGTLALGDQPPAGPLGIYGLTTPDATPFACVMLGDSFLEAGWARRAVDAQGHAWSDVSTWLEIIPRNREQLANRLPAVGTWPYDVAFALHAGNDSGRPTGEQQALHIAAWRMYRDAGVPIVYGLTIHPYSSSTDGYTTIEGQSVDTGRKVGEFNEWVRDGAPLDAFTFAPAPVGGTGVRFGEEGHPAAGFFDVHAACAVSPDAASVWKVGDGTEPTGSAWTADGAHLSSYGSARLQEAFTAWLAAHM